jgi:TolB protein
MFRSLVLFLLCAAFPVHAADAPRKLAYARGSVLYVANLDGSGAKKIATGAWPDLSPDGTKLAFNTEDPSGKTPERCLAIADVATGKVTKIPNIPSNNCHSPVWSPDGTRVLFQIHTDNDWHVGLIGSDGSDFRYIKKADPANHSFYSIVWAPDGKGFYCQDLDTINHFGLNGALQEQWQVAKLFPKGGMSSGVRLAVSPNGGTLLVDVEMDEDVTRKDWDGPPPSIWSLNLANGRATRLTPKGLFAWEPCWVSTEAFLCLVQPVSAREPSIYRMSADGKMRQALIKNARDPSASR